jgi:RNA polymerase sigma-70 factor, ECF subfamily
MIWDQAPASQRADGLEQNRALKVVLANEASLVEAAQRGDLSAFNQLVLAYQDDLYGWVISYVQDMETAVDITQQAFITAYQKIHTLRYGSFRAWIFRIARNRSIDELRYRRCHPMLRLDGEPQDEEALGLLSILPADAPLPEEAVIQSEQAEWLLELLDSLPKHFRQVLQLVEIYEMDYQEAASVLNVPVGTLKSRLARARLRMREQIEQRGILC